MLTLNALKTIDFLDFTDRPNRFTAHTRFLTVSGYEARSASWAGRLIEAHPDIRQRFTVFGFDELHDDESRRANDDFYRSWGIDIISASSVDTAGFLSF